MDTNARQVATCLPAETLARIAEYEEKAREARTGAALSGVSAGRMDEKPRAFPAKGEEKPQTGKVIALPVGRPKRSRTNHGRPAVLLRFDLAMRRREGRHAAALWDSI